LQRVVRAYQEFKDEPGFTRVVNADDIRAKEWSLNISLFVVNGEHRRTGMRSSGGSLEEAFLPWLASAKTTRESLATITGGAATDGLLAVTQKLKVQLPSWLDRSKWQHFKFGEIADCIREPGQPTPQDSATYIGLEYMDTGSLHVRRWGSEADLKGQKLKMRKGDILFAKRNAYLRRVAIAPHDGFFSAHGMILRARPDKVLPEFLPFLMMSDRFMNRAVEISVGSLSPTINGTTLKLETFDLPPLDQQRRIAEILWAVDEQQQANLAVVEALNELNQAKKSKWLDADSLDYPRKSLTEICDPTQWQTISQRDLEESGVPVFGANGYIGFFHTANHQSDTIAITCRGSTCGTVNWIPGPSYITGNSMCLENLIGELDQRYLFEILLHLNMRTVITGSAQPQITRASLASLRVPLPPMKVQRAWVSELAALRSANEQATTHANNTAQLGRAMNEQLTAP
jgi:restriction endonuclease S subunit